MGMNYEKSWCPVIYIEVWNALEVDVGKFSKGRNGGVALIREGLDLATDYDRALKKKEEKNHKGEVKRVGGGIRKRRNAIGECDQ